MQPPATKCVLIERSKGDADVLQQRCATLEREVVVLTGDCNDRIAAALDLFDDRRLPAFCLFDPAGLELSWEVIRFCADRRSRGTPYELLIYFSTPGVMRTASVIDERMIEGDERALRRVFGNDAWLPIAERQRARNIDGREAGNEYLALYKQQIEGLGYSHVMSRPSVADHNRLIYHLVFASSHDAGQNIMEDGFKRAYASQLPLQF